MRRRAALAAVLASALSLSGCTLLAPIIGGGETTVSSYTDETVSAELEPYYKQDVTWKSCGSGAGAGADCTTVIAPTDWDNPSGDRIELAISRQRATGEKKGSLLLNPGGPGGSGYDYGLGFAGTDALRENFDIIGFDPRGVGRSTPIICFTNDADRDEMLYGTYDDPYGSDGWVAELASRQKAWVDACEKNTGDLLANIDTVSVATDMDMIRAVLGDDKLNYLGYSFGTYIGTIYANLFPEKVGTMVLDGAVEPPFGTFDELATQMAGFDSAFRAYMQSCLDGSDCPFSGSLDSALAQANDLVVSVDGQNLESSDGRELDSATVGTGIALTLYNQSNWPYLTQGFTELRDGNPDTMFLLADSYNGREGGSYADRSIDVYFAVTCAEGTIGTDDIDVQEGLAIMQQRAPIVGGSLALDDYVLLEESCSQWPYERPTDFPTTFNAAGAPPILVIGTTNDPATPYQQSVDLAATLDSGVMVSYEGEGHTVFGNGVACIDNVVDAYFVDGVVPPADPMC